jgi:hypothetical protein
MKFKKKLVPIIVELLPVMLEVMKSAQIRKTFCYNLGADQNCLASL